MDYFYSVITEIWELLCEMSPYLLLGFLLAGLMHEFVPSKLYTRYLSGSSFRSVLYSALVGVPLPLCSCGVIPTAMGLRREGASKGATLSFLIATPQTGVDSIIATYSLMGLPFAIVRPIAALATSLFGGQLCNILDTKEQAIPHAEHREEEHEHEGLAHRLCEAVSYAFVEMMEDIGKWLAVGLIVAGIITAIVPDSWFVVFRDNTPLSILFVLVFSIPMYLCATGSIPIAVALMIKGLTPGAALVLLMAGPASNAASMLVINKVLGRRTLAIYLSSIITGAVVFAFGIDYLLPREWFLTPVVSHAGCCSEHLGIFSYICTTLMILLLINALSPHKLFGSTHCHCHDGQCHCHEEETITLYNIKGMNCNHCAASVEKALKGVEGVEEINVSLENGQVKVHGIYNEEEALKAVESLGFDITRA